MTAADNLAAVIDGPAELAPDRLALALADGSTCSYGELHDEVERWAATLASSGVGEGDVVGLGDRGGVRSAAATLAAAHVGAATAQMNPLLTASELAQLVAVSGAGPIGVSGPDGVEAPRTGLGPGGPGPDGPGAPPPPPRAGGGDGTALVLFTSGTTG